MALVQIMSVNGPVYIDPACVVAVGVPRDEDGASVRLLYLKGGAWFAIVDHPKNLRLVGVPA